MLTATLLDPRVSQYQSELGKALYQVRAFDRALEVYDYATQLDPRDPTPHFYKGIALSDLNRPGEAIQEINRSIELNDNVAIFRSHLMLDRERAVRNYNLARSYNQLGLGEWAYSKAVTAVNRDPTNSSANLFLSKSFTKSEALAAEQELLLFRVLSPANQNTFMNLVDNDYTPMFEMPYNRATLQGGIGNWEREKNHPGSRGEPLRRSPRRRLLPAGKLYPGRGLPGSQRRLAEPRLPGRVQGGAHGQWHSYRCF